MRIEAPELRIVSEALWQAVHDRMARRRAVYLDRTGPKRHGRPLARAISPYLLTGFVSCGCCEGSLTVRSRPHRRRREPRLACYHYMTRGRRVCCNNYEAPLAALDALVVEAIEQDILAADVTDAAIRRAIDTFVEGETDDEQTARDVRREVKILDSEMERLTALAASGAFDIPSVLEALRTRQERRQALLARAIRWPGQRVQTTRAQLEATFRKRLTDCRSLLRRTVPENGQF